MKNQDSKQGNPTRKKKRNTKANRPLLGYTKPYKNFVWPMDKSKN